MNVTITLKPAPHCQIPFGHPLHRGYVPAEHTDIRKTFERAGEYSLLDDYDFTTRTDYLAVIGAWK